ncbi:hypothetical protein WICPIJ_003532 [Wickerhamomyces pijperi]|uniref:Uncharacterized protein n=1 Tax=Wickerhamomyces pijperi TaxID=599730 RepID=A0A9P8Q9G5_WICPI|nr:hypothetical protein WICPIJ_003532 [Wickerhamomyces pijperi]
MVLLALFKEAFKFSDSTFDALISMSLTGEIGGSEPSSSDCVASFEGLNVGISPRPPLKGLDLVELVLSSSNFTLSSSISSFNLELTSFNSSTCFFKS